MLTPQFINGILVLLLTKKSNKRLIKIVNYNCLTKSIAFDIFILRFEKKRKWSLKTEQNVNSISRDTNILKLQIIWKRFNIFFGEFDPGSGWTLAACLRHASRTKKPNEDWVLARDWNWILLSGRRVSNTWVIYLRDWDNVWKRTLIPDKSYLEN